MVDKKRMEGKIEKKEKERKEKQFQVFIFCMHYIPNSTHPTCEVSIKCKYEKIKLRQKV